MFDGIKWTTVESTSIISENWNFLSSTFDGDNIGIFVNGTREATQEVVGVPTLTTNGKLDTTTVENLTSEEDIVIGATITTKNEEQKASNQFSGEIDDVSLYDYVLADEQIIAMYEQTKDAYAVIVPELTLEEILAQMEAEQLASQSNQTATENVTSNEIITEESIIDTEILSAELEQSIEEQESQIIIVPEISSLDDSYDLGDDVTFDLEFYDEYDALMLEIAEIESATELLLAETEQSIAELENTEPTETQTTIFSGFLFGLERFLPLQMADAAKPGEIDDLKIALGKAKQKLEELKTDAAELKTQTPDEQTVKQLKIQLKDTVKEIKSIIKKLEKAKLSAQASKLESITESAEKIGDVKSEEKQNGKWSDDDSELETNVYDSKGNKVKLAVSYEKIREGKFNVKFSPDTETKPGVYKIVSTFTVDGVEHTVESEFAWGLVSLNTAKSIYKPGETAEFVIVVLDAEGHPIDGAELEMSITNPNGKRSFLETGDEIVSGSETGLYETEFAATGVEGTYNVLIHATAPGIDVPFETTFDVRESYEYDIVRTAQSKIDPTTNPNAFDVIIDIESFTDADTITITETIPSVLEVETDATVITVGDRKVLTWTKDLVNDKTSVSYTYSVPFVFPSLYDLGPLEISDGNVIFTEARSWYVANDPATSPAANPGASVSVTTNGWSTTTDAHTNDGTPADAKDGETAQWTTFGFTTGSGGGLQIPSGATIDGIEITFETYLSGNSGNDQFSFTASIIKGGAVQTALGTTCVVTSTSTANTCTLGSSTEKWNTTWVDTDIAGATTGFGVQLTSARDAGKGGEALDLDVIDMVVHYTAGSTTAPDPPTGLTASYTSPTQYDLSWTAGNDGGSAITGYFIEINKNGGGWTTEVANTGSTSTSYPDTDLTAGDDASYRVSAINPIGTSTASLESNVVTTPTVPSAPLSLTATTIDDTSIEINWSQPTTNGGSVIQTFSIQNDASGTFTQIGTVGVNITTFTHTGLSDGTNYNYQVVAVNNVGNSPASNQANAWTLPSAPTNLVANAISSGDTLELEWDQPTGTVTEYRVQRALMGATNWATSDCNVERSLAL